MVIMIIEAVGSLQKLYTTTDKRMRKGHNEVNAAWHWT